MRVTASNLVVLRPPKWGALWLRPLGVEASRWNPRITPPPHSDMCYLAEFGRCWSDGTSVIKMIRLKKIDPSPPAFQGHSRYRSRHWSSRRIWFPINVCSNHGPISYRFQDKRRLQSKITNFSYPRVFRASAERVPLELGTGAGGQKTTMMGLPGREGSLTISSAIWIQYTNVTDGRTDRHRATANTTLIYAWRRAVRNTGQHC